MTRILISITIIINTSLAFASPQIGDYYIIGKDTFNVQHYPLYSFFEKYPNSALEAKIRNDSIFAFCAVRGYIATWKIENDSLFLVNIGVEGNIDDILRRTFANNYKNGKVFAFWNTESLFIPNGKRIRNNPYFRVCEKEFSFNFRKGKLISKKEIVNYIKVKNGIARNDNKKVCDTLFYNISKNLDWKRLGEEFCDDEYFITISSKGKISKVRFIPMLDSKWQNFWFSIEERKCRRKIYKSIKHLRFDILKMNGNHYNEEIAMKIFYNDDTKELENWNN